MGISVRDVSKNVSSNINVTPMVDVMLVLLIIFMVITPMLQNKVSVEMAKVDNATAMPDADKEDAIVVAVTRDGGVFLGQDKVAPTELGRKVADKLADKPGKMIFVRADARAQYKAVEDAIDGGSVMWARQASRYEELLRDVGYDRSNPLVQESDRGLRDLHAGIEHAREVLDDP